MKYTTKFTEQRRSIRGQINYWRKVIDARRRDLNASLAALQSIQDSCLHLSWDEERMCPCHCLDCGADFSQHSDEAWEIIRESHPKLWQEHQNQICREIVLDKVLTNMLSGAKIGQVPTEGLRP